MCNTGCKNRCFLGKREEGFTLLEVMVALSIFTAGMMSIMALFIAGIALHREAAAKTTASLLAERIMGAVEGEIISAYETNANLPSGELELPKFEDFPGFRGEATLIPLQELEEDPAGLLEVLVQVRVFWRKGGADKEETFYSIFPWGETYEERVRKAGK